MSEWVMNDFCWGHQEALPGEVVGRLSWESSRKSLGREGGRALKAGRTARAKAERCGSIWYVLESVGIRVYVWLYRVLDKVGPDCTSYWGVGTGSQLEVGRIHGEERQSWWLVCWTHAQGSAWRRCWRRFRFQKIINPSLGCLSLSTSQMRLATDGQAPREVLLAV